MDSSPTHHKSTITTTNNEDTSLVTNKPSNSLLFNIDYEYNNLHKILQFGRELFQMNTTLDSAESQANTKMLRVIIKKIYFHWFIFRSYLNEIKRQ